MLELSQQVSKGLDVASGELRDRRREQAVRRDDA